MEKSLVDEVKLAVDNEDIDDDDDVDDDVDQQNRGELMVDCLKRAKWVDVTDKLFKICAKLPVGQLMHSSSFSLGQALHAIELMELKMDAGMRCYRTDVKFTGFDDAIKRASIKLDGFTDDDRCWLFKTSFSSLVCWLDGQTLEQTVYSNVYLERPDAVLDVDVRWFSLALCKVVKVVQDLLNGAQVYAEEDFTLGTDFSERTLSYSVESVLDGLESVVKLRQNESSSELSSSSSSSSPPPPPLSSSLLLSSSLSSSEVVELMKLMLNFLGVLWHVRSVGSLAVGFEEKLVSFCWTGRTICDGILEKLTAATATAGRSDGQLLSDHPAFEPSLRIGQLAPSFPKSIECPPFVEAVEYLRKTFHDLSEVGKLIVALRARSYSQLANALAAFNAYFRPTVLTRSMCYVICLCAEPQPNGTSTDDRSNDRLIASGQSDHDYFSTVNVQLIVESTNGLFFHLLNRTCVTAGLKPAHVPDWLLPDGDAVKLFNAFKEYMGPFEGSNGLANPSLIGAWTAFDYTKISLIRAVKQMLTTSLLNRCRQREHCARLLTDMQSCSEHALLIDSELIKWVRACCPADVLARITVERRYTEDELGPLSCFVVYWSTRLMFVYVLLGFELELYRPDELVYIYWYLAEKLCVFMMCDMSRLTSFWRANDSLINYFCKKCAPMRKSGKKSRRPAVPKFNTNDFHRMENERRLYAVLHSLFAGYYRLLAAVDHGHSDHHDCDDQKTRPIWDCEAQRYMMRFAAFTVVRNPPFAPYDQFRSAVDRLQKPSEDGSCGRAMALKQAVENFSEAQQLLERSADIFPSFNYETENNDESPLNVRQWLINLCKQNTVAARLLLQTNVGQPDSSMNGRRLRVRLQPDANLAKLAGRFDGRDLAGFVGAQRVFFDGFPPAVCVALLPLVKINF